MSDPVNNPAHYNQNGIEVIDVIETYAKEDFRLANVIKYVCRCEYKGKKLEDLKKAAWYLNRVIDELAPCEGYTPREVEVFFQGYDCRKQEEDEQPEDLSWQDFPGLVATLPADRIAGDDAIAQRIKDAYYSHDRHEIHGYCANCDKELPATEAYITQQAGYETEVKFCSTSCVDKLREWQGR